MRSTLLAIACLCSVGLGGCTKPSNPASPSTGRTVTLNLEEDADGNLQYCDAESGECVAGLPNPNDCAILEITIDTGSGATCERCLDAAGNVVTDTCQDASVACALITIPE